MRTKLFAAAIGLALSFNVFGPATASPKAASHALAEGRFVLAPFSYTKFCVDYPAECPHAGGAARVHMTAGRMKELAEVNREVNAAIVPTPDTSKFRFWALNVSQGDCNEFAVQKRHDLMHRGWSAGSLALAVVKTSWGEGHLVLTVRTDAGDLVLDSLRPAVLPWERTGYRWVMRQSERDPQYWASLEGGHVGPVLAAQANENGAEQTAAAAKPEHISRLVPATASLARASDVPNGVVNSALTRGAVRIGRDMILGFDAWRTRNQDLAADVYDALPVVFSFLGGSDDDVAPPTIVSGPNPDENATESRDLRDVAIVDEIVAAQLRGRI